MAPSSRDRISVDLHGLKAMLFDRAHALGVSPSGLVRTTLTEALGSAQSIDLDGFTPRQRGGHDERVRLCLRMSREQARATMDAARRAQLSLGDYVAGLVANVPVLSNGSSRSDYITALTASSAELSTLAHNIYRLTALLRQANVPPARPYREMLDTLDCDVRSHLHLAACVLADLQPRKRGIESRPGNRS